jgi:hypothetical protein
MNKKKKKIIKEPKTSEREGALPGREYGIYTLWLSADISRFTTGIVLADIAC